MSNDILISIIIPVYNLEDYIASTLEALLREDLSEMEVIVIDDGSTDKTFSIASSLLEHKCVNHQIIKQDNAGVSAARNHGVIVASGEYIYFLDGDDIVKNECFEGIKRLIGNRKFDLICFGFDKADEFGNILQDFDTTLTFPKKDISIEDFITGLIKKQYGVRIGSVVLKKSIFVENRLFFHVGSRYGEDKEFLYKCIISSSNFHFIRSTHLNYVLRSTSAMSTKRIQIFDPVFAYERVYEYFKAHERGASMAQLIHSISIPESAVRCIMRGVREGQLQISLMGRLPAGMKKRLQGVRYLAFELDLRILLAIFMLIHFPGLFALAIRKQKWGRV